MGQKRRHFSSSEKLLIVKKHLLEGVVVSDICDEFNIKPTLFYRWQKILFEKGNLTFESTDKSREKVLEIKINNLERKMIFKDEVLAELMGEHITLKKSLGVI